MTKPTDIVSRLHADIDELAKALESSSGGQLNPAQQSHFVPPQEVLKLPKEGQEIFEQASKAADGDDDAKMSAGWKAVKGRYKKCKDGSWMAKTFYEVRGDVADHLRRTLLTDGYPEVADGIMQDPPMLELDLLPDGYREVILKRYFEAEARKDMEEFSVEVAFKALLEEKKITYGVVYPPDQVDLQKEWATEDTVEKAAHNFMMTYRGIDTFHNERDGAGVPVESFIAPCDIHEFHGKKLAPDQVIKKGSWVMATKWTDDSWKLVKEGKIRGYSIGGFKKVRR